MRHQLIERYIAAQAPAERWSLHHNVHSQHFHDGVDFRLSFIFDGPPPEPWHLNMDWLSGEDDQRRRFTVHVSPASRIGPGPNSSPLQHQAWKVLERERKIRSMIDPFARPRLLLPAEWWKDDGIALELLAQLVLCAARFGELKPSNKDVLLFREYSFQIAGYYLRGFSDADKNGVVDRVFERFYLKGKVGRGFMASIGARAFRSYVKQAIRGEAYNKRKRDRQPLQRKLRGSPASIAEAAETLGIDFSTVWRRMRSLGYEQWTPEAWEKIRTAVSAKSTWRTVLDRLEESGLSPDAARKRVSRWKEAGIQAGSVLSQVRQRPKPQECASCGDPAHVTYEGKHYCVVCYQEKR